jgi:hypothetical protein
VPQHHAAWAMAQREGSLYSSSKRISRCWLLCWTQERAAADFCLVLDDRQVQLVTRVPRECLG